MIFSTIKKYLFLGTGLLVTGLLIAVKFLAGQNSRLRVENKTKEAHNKHMTKVMEADIEIDEQADTHLAEVAKEIEDAGATDALADPNAGWLRDDNGSE